jgi:hypothetical protein
LGHHGPRKKLTNSGWPSAREDSERGVPLSSGRVRLGNGSPGLSLSGIDSLAYLETGRRIDLDVQSGGMTRALRIGGLVVGAAIVVLVVAGLLWRPKVSTVVTPSGRRYDILSDLVTSDGHYFIKYLAHSANPSKLDEGANDLMQLVTSDPRAVKLRTISVEATVGFGIGVFRLSTGYGYVFENQARRWERAGKQGIHDNLIHQGHREIGSAPP